MGRCALTPAQAAKVYDRIGRIQDWQRFYESPAVADLVSHADFEHSRSIYELGCGTGATAAALLDGHLPASATYRGVDVSAKMVQRTASRLAPYGERVSVDLVTGEPPLAGEPGHFDRFVALYVFDLLTDQLAHKLLEEARRLLDPQGRLCLVSLTHGPTPPSRVLCAAWNQVWRISPGLLGGCRPIDVRDRLDGWHIEYDNVVVSWAVPSQIVIASPAAT